MVLLLSLLLTGGEIALRQSGQLAECRWAAEFAECRLAVAEYLDGQRPQLPTVLHLRMDVSGAITATADGEGGHARAVISEHGPNAVLCVISFGPRHCGYLLDGDRK
jgi:hypothetical protein